MTDLFKLREGTMPAFAMREGPSFATPASALKAPQYHFIEDDELAESLAEKDHLKRVSGDRLDDVLGGDAETAIEAIETGEVDDILDAVLFAERERDDRAHVISALAERSDELASQQAQQEQTVTPRDLVTK